MIFPRRRVVLTALAAFGIAGAATARADVIPYPTPGVENPVLYSFTATASGDVIGYFTGSTASYTESVGMFVNGVLSPNGFGLDNQTSTIGESFDFGTVVAGDTLVFAIEVTSPPDSPPYVYSDAALNGPYDYGTPGPGANHIYSVPYTATSPVFPGVPVGTYVAFEDLPAPVSDFNYFDETYVFTDVSTHPVPEPASLVLLLTGVLGFAAVRRSAR